MHARSEVVTRRVVTRRRAATPGARWIVAIGVCLASVALAQAHDTGTREVVMTPRLTVSLPSVVQLRLAASEVVFDLGGDLQSGTLACVYGPATGDVPAGAVAVLEHQPAVFPLGTGFRPDAHPAVRVEGTGPVTAYPPLRFDGSGSVLERSDLDFVCYRTFLLHRFANAEAWQLSVERPAAGDSALADTVYIRASGCEPSSDLQGLFALPPGERRLLASARESAACPEGDVIVLAVKTHAARAGERTTHLVYTLMAPLYEAPP